MALAEQVPARSDIAPQHTWNAESVFPTREDWHAEYEALVADIPKLSAFAGTLGQGSARLADWLETEGTFKRRAAKLYFYAVMSFSVDTSDEEAKAMAGLVGRIAGYGDLAGEAKAAAAFAEPEIIALGADTLNAWIKDEPRLAGYAHYLQDLLRKAAHVRSPEVEELLGMASEPFAATAQTATMLTNADLTFDDAAGSPVTQSNMPALMSHPDRETRREAWENFADGYLAFKNTLASNYIASVKQNVFNMRARRFDSTLEAVLFPHNIPTSVFHNLIDTFKKNIPTWHRYWEVRRKALKVDQIHPYDIWAPLTENEPEVDYAQGVEWIAEGMAPLGADYVDALKRGCLEERWVDIYPNRGKRQGAFSGGSYDTYPFIMMSYTGGLKSMSTLAHELGHSMHSYLSRKNQPVHYAYYSMFAAETASNFNQALVRAYLFEQNDDPIFQIALIEEAMSNFHRYFFIMPTLARFEFEVHSRVEQGKPLSADVLNGIMRDLFAEGYGDTLADDPERTGITWAQFGHLYVPFYTFQYATGISAAHALADGILKGEANAVENYLKFLSAGSSVYPIDALHMAGVDMSTPEPVEKAFAVLGDLVDRLEKLTG